MSDCSTYDQTCIDEIASITAQMNDAAGHLNDAVVDCGGSENEECANDILATIDDITEATNAITQVRNV